MELLSHQIEKSEYFIPDSTWEAFGINDLATYLDRCIVKGQFHKDVPEDIVNSYNIAEHIMAHAYYNYPSFDEALVKLLRIIEMAMKIRCSQLNLPLEEIKRGKTGEEKKVKYVLRQLIEQYGDWIGNDDFKQQLHWSRNVRNIFMHPSYYSYIGPIGKGTIRNVLNILNKLFLPEEYFAKEKDTIENARRLLSSYQPGQSVYTKNDFRYLIHSIDVEETVIINGTPIFLFVITAVIKNITDQLTNHSIQPPFFVYVSSSDIKPNIIVGTDRKDDTEFLIQTSQHEENKVTYVQYLEDLNSVDEKDIGVYRASIASDIGKESSLFLYKYFHQINPDEFK